MALDNKMVDDTVPMAVDLALTFARKSAAVVGQQYQFIPVFVLVQSVLFFIIYMASYMVTTIPKKRATLASCYVSFMHNIVAVVGTTIQLKQLWPFAFDDINTRETNVLLQYSVAYMITDFICFLLPFTPADIVFIVHHFVTGTYMLDCVHLQRAGVSVMPWMWLGELTGPLLNAFSAARELKSQFKVADKVFRVLSPVFTVVFLIVRTGGFLPMYVWWARGLVYDCSSVPAWHRVYWAVCTGLGVLGSQLWSYKLLRGFLKQRSAAKKQQ